MPLEIIRNDITSMQVDAIVNIVNAKSVIGVDVDSEIHAKAGPMLLLACKLIGYIKIGKARLTAGFKLPVKYIIHTVAPIWTDGTHEEMVQLKQCYNNSLKLEDILVSVHTGGWKKAAWLNSQRVIIFGKIHWVLPMLQLMQAVKNMQLYIREARKKIRKTPMQYRSIGEFK